MFSKILIKLIDQAIIPAIILLVARVASVFLLARFFKITVLVNNTGFVFENHDEYALVNSYSILAMLVVLSVGILYILTKSFLFHDTHITPALTTKLFTMRISTFIQNSFDLYSQGTVWLSYLYLMFLITGAMAYFGLVYAWVFVVSLVLVLISTVLFIYDIERESSLHTKTKDGENSEELEEQYVLTFEDEK